eukprot:1161687-Pelagomonas_calceolata.AAC.9
MEGSKTSKAVVLIGMPPFLASLWQAWFAQSLCSFAYPLCSDSSPRPQQLCANPLPAWATQPLAESGGQDDLNMAELVMDPECDFEHVEGIAYCLYQGVLSLFADLCPSLAFAALPDFKSHMSC